MKSVDLKHFSVVLNKPSIYDKIKNWKVSTFLLMFTAIFFFFFHNARISVPTVKGSFSPLLNTVNIWDNTEIIHSNRCISWKKIQLHESGLERECFVGAVVHILKYNLSFWRTYPRIIPDSFPIFLVDFCVYVFIQMFLWMSSLLQRCVCAVALLKTTNSCRWTNPLPTSLLPSITMGDKTSPLQTDAVTTSDPYGHCECAFYIVSGKENCKAEVGLNDFLRSLQTSVFLGTYDRWQCSTWDRSCSYSVNLRIYYLLPSCCYSYAVWCEMLHELTSWLCELLSSNKLFHRKY